MARPRVTAAAALMASLAVISGPSPAQAAPPARPSEPVRLFDQLRVFDTGAVRGGLHNQRISVDSNPPEPQFDPSVAVSLLEPRVAVAAFTDGSQPGIQLARTHDSGRHWTAMPFSARDTITGLPCRASEPKVAFSRRDDAFYALLHCSNSVSGLIEGQLLKSVDGGVTWTGSSSASLAFANHPPGEDTIDAATTPDWIALAIDNSPTSPYYGRIYAGHVRFHFVAPENAVIDRCPAHIAYTDDVPTVVPADATWTDVPVMPPGSPVDASAAADLRLAVDDRGGVDVLYANENCNSYMDYGISFTRSTDGGAGYPAATHITRPAFFSDNPDPDDDLPGKDTAVVIAPSITFSFASRSLHVAYHNFANQAESASDMSHQRSTDYGATWSPARPISVRRNGRPAPNDQFLGWITADPRTGYLHAVFLDNRNDPGNRLIETFQAFSGDDGQTWRNANISSAAWDPLIGAAGEPFAGNLNGIAAVGDRIYPVWGDARDPGPVTEGHGGLDIFTNTEPRGSPAQR